MRKEESPLTMEREPMKRSVFQDEMEAIYPSPVRALLSAASLGKIKAHFQVVAEAFSCPADIVSALEAYLGARQFWLISHTIEDAQEGIDFLYRQHAYGRVTFLPLERCSPRFPDARFSNAAGVIGWCVDLIEPIAPWKPALHHLLGNLLIVESHEFGQRLFRESVTFPIATMKGEIFTPAGTVIGGRTSRNESAVGRRQRMSERMNHTNKM